MNIKKIIASVFTVAMMLSFIPANVMADSTG